MARNGAEWPEMGWRESRADAGQQGEAACSARAGRVGCADGADWGEPEMVPGVGLKQLPQSDTRQRLLTFTFRMYPQKYPERYPAT